MDIILTIIGAWLFADFFVGFIHWFQDKCLSRESKIPFIKEVSIANDLHHIEPMHMLTLTKWKNMNTSVMIGLPLSIVLFLINAHPIFQLGVFFSYFGNIIHRWSHEPSKKLNPLIRFLQRVGTFQSKEVHNRHHFDENGVIQREDAIENFCVMTNYLNPTINWILKKFR